MYILYTPTNQGCGSGWSLTGSNPRKKNPDPTPDPQPCIEPWYYMVAQNTVHTYGVNHVFQFG